jgi:hypothetical protein
LLPYNGDRKEEEKAQLYADLKTNGTENKKEHNK